MNHISVFHNYYKFFLNEFYVINEYLTNYTQG